ncbi:MAG: outer membrane beta-barrel protein, partial [Caulobacteraceae bacterium]
SKGVQVNYTKGAWAASLALTDGYYSGDFTSVSGLVTYTFKNSDTLAFAGEGNAGTYRAPTALSTFVTPPQQANGQIYNVIYTHTKGPLTISPYVQYSNSPNIPGVSAEGETWGGAILAKWSFTPQMSLAGRFEYISSDGPANLLGYGVGSRAWSITLTPTYQRGVLFVRGEVSYVGALSGTPGLMFGAAGLSGDQTRALVETGAIF